MKHILILLFLLPTSANAQFCETVTDSAWSARFDALLAQRDPMFRALADTGVVEVPVIFHVQTQGGSPVVSDGRIGDALKTTNEYYFRGGIRFVRCGETRYYPEGTSPECNNPAVNVDVYRSSTGCAYEVGGRVYINIACPRTLENILSHELGHTVGLPHTHGPTNSGTTTELVDGSNCTTAGDKFCDTPADPNLNGKVDAACRYTGTARDLRGMEYQPLTNTVMSYTASHCADSLTPMQLARARAVALSTGYDCCHVAPPQLHDTSVCVGTSVVLTATTSAPDVRWFDAAKGGTLLGSGRVFVTPPVSEDRSWFAEAVDSCISRRARVTVTVGSMPDVVTEGALAVFDPDTAKQSTIKILTADSLGIVLQADGGALWYFDGRSGSGRQLAASPPVGKSLLSVLLWNNMLLYFLYDEVLGPSLHRVDLPSGNTTEIFVQNERWRPSNFWLTPIDGAVVFFLNGGEYKTELWRSDGTTTGTYLVKQFPYTDIFSAFNITAVDGKAVFRADDFEHGPELWVTDGSESGTRMIADIRPGLNGSNPASFAQSDGLVYFRADDGVTGAELWVTDFTHEGTHRVADINPGAGSSSPASLTSRNGLLFMSADNGSGGFEPFVSDGTSEGTQWIENINPGRSSFPEHFTALGERIFCLADGGNGAELWELLDRGVKGAKLVKRIDPVLIQRITELAVHDSLLFFAANDRDHGIELWCSDGSEDGTRMYADIDTVSSSRPEGFRTLGGKLYFIASNHHGAALHTISSDAATVCSGERARLMIVHTTGVLRWYTNESGGDPIGSGRVFDTPPLEESATFWVEVDDGVCVSPRKPLRVHVRASRPRISGPSSVLLGSDVMLEAAVPGGVIEWHARGDGTAPLDTGSTLHISSLQCDTTVFARSVEGPCSSALVPHRISVHTGTDVSTVTHAAHFHLHPFPASDRLTVDLGEVFNGDLRVTDLLGRELLHRRVSFDGRYELNVAELRAGTYFLELSDRVSRRAKMFMVAR
ncbi:MAG: hypothetical protein M5R41_10665 [Bacteroidia bacterium]|nr:hypothetical protein [Bacteroidia bacterium]